ncbi:hypothetical protein MK489_22845 [Myxococcota bacterium]|nr:hypothetical protein [Myxococcota bacterium]
MDYRYFERPAPGEAWSRKIERWQLREKRDHTRSELAAVSSATVDSRVDATPDSPSTELREKYESFRAAQRQDLARGLVEWIQSQALDHYIEDGAIDHWATFEETLQTNGDDCDGLELLTFHLLRDLGFGEENIYRAVVYRRSDDQHHMVTLWFEDPSDPWVIDPTGAMTKGMRKMSELPDWAPVKVFTEDRDYTVLNRLRISG